MFKIYLTVLGRLALRVEVIGCFLYKNLELDLSLSGKKEVIYLKGREIV